MKYRHSNEERGYRKENGGIEIVAVCDICGAEHKTHHGFDITLDSRKSERSARRKYCAKCANQIIPIIERALDEAMIKGDFMRSHKEVIPNEDHP